MSERLISLEKNGSGGSQKLQETVLWTNSSPTSSFSQQTITLSDNLSNYDYISLTWCSSTSNTSKTLTAMLRISDFMNSKNVLNGISIQAGGYGSTSSAAYSRVIGYDTDSTVYFGSALGLGTSNNNAYSIPLSVRGLKYVTSGGSMSETVIWTNTNHSTTDSNITVTCAEGYGSYDLIKVYYSPYTTATDVSNLGTMWIIIDPVYAIDNPSGYPQYRPVLGALVNQPVTKIIERVMYFSSSTALVYTKAIIQGDNSGTSYNHNCVPTKITGLNIL